MSRIAAVVVTFNRRELVTACLRNLIDQTLPLDRIYVIDNASTDGTKDALAAAGLLDLPALEYVSLAKNTGGAGGFHEGMRLAFEAGFDWIWIMDDDGEPALDALELMAPWFDKPDVAAVLPMIANAKGEPEFVEPHRGFILPRSEMTFDDFGRTISPEDIAGEDAVEINFYSFVGPCFARWAVEKAGLPIRDFFIHYDDIEYSQRIARIGKAMLIPGARIVNREAQKVDIMEMAPGGKRTQLRYDRLWLRYFGYRNRIWLITRRKLDAPLFPVFYGHIKLMARILLFEGQKQNRLKFWNSAFLDGLRGRFDNDKAKAILSRP